MNLTTRTPAERLAAYRSKHVIRDHLDTSDGLHCGLDGLRVIPKWDHKLRHDPSEITRLAEAVKDDPVDREPLSFCQFCLADPRYTKITDDQNRRCPVCGADYTGPRRDAEAQALLALSAPVR